MPPQFTKADSLRQYLTGALVDGGVQTSPLNSLGGFRSSTEAVSLGITILNPISGVSILFAGGANPPGQGILTTIDTNHLTWQPFGMTNPGPPAVFTGINDTEIVEADNQPGQYLRITASTPFTPTQSQVNLAYLMDNVFSGDDITVAQSTTQVNEYRATIVRNESGSTIQSWQKYLATFGTPQISNIGFLPASGSGTISTNGSFIDWPVTGWCQVQSSSGTIKEVVYYSSRTNTQLTVPAAGRAALTTSATAGSLSDVVYGVPGIAIGLDPAGVQSFGASIQTVANEFTAPAGVTWNLALTPAAGLQIGTLGPNQQIGIWMWRQTPAGIISSPSLINKMLDSYNAF